MESADDNVLQLSWLAWWHSGFWRQADNSWHADRLTTLPAEAQQRLWHQHASALHASLGIAATPICAPQPLILAMAQLTPADRLHMLQLVAEICGSATTLPAELKIWCRRLAKGLRTERWLPPGLFSNGQHSDSLLLLQALYPSLWPRLRLMFPQPMAANSPAAAPPVSASRLLPLWQAALWQCQRQQSSETAGESDVES